MAKGTKGTKGTNGTPERIEEDSFLSADELKIVDLWRSGMSKKDAYSQVMITPAESENISENTLKQRVRRFFSTERIKAAMANSAGARGVSEKKRQTRSRKEKQQSAAGTFAGIQKTITDDSIADDPTTAWMKSLQITTDPTAMSVYGTGLFIMQQVVQQIISRKKAIDAMGISPLDSDGCPYTNTDMSALRTAASMVIPFAPPPTTAERRAMAMAGVIVGLTQETVGEHINPKDYEAEPPNGVIDVKKGDE